VGWSATVPEFYGHPGNNTIVAAISFLDITENQKGPNQGIKEDGEGLQPCLVAKICVLTNYE
jgi:hypothetical protein